MPNENHPPVIETERLRLRPHQVSDFTDCVAMWSDPAIARYTIGEPAPPQRTWQRILAYRGHWVLLGFGFWAVEEKSSGRYIGEMGFAEHKRAIQPSLGGMPELGWALIAEAHGKGYATEGLRTAVDWGDSHFGLIDTACIIHPENHLSFRVADKLGYRERIGTPTDGETAIVLVRSPLSIG
jgi:RimJ/RimL family protein N-acetyltransferase